jgi:hypothetical protein
VVITAAASKYSGGAPPWLNACGRMPGATVATTLNVHATPVPIAMSVNMLRLRVRIEAQPRSKNGQPAHNTTGVARRSWSHIPSWAETSAASGWPGMMSAIARTTTGTVSAMPMRRRRVMSISSWLGGSIALIAAGSSAIPQIGQFPGVSCTIWGCIGQT